MPLRGSMLIVQERRPTGHDFERLILLALVKQDALAIRRNCERSSGKSCGQRKQRLRRQWLQAVRSIPEAAYRQFAVARKIEQLASVRPPLWESPAAARH